MVTLLQIVLSYHTQNVLYYNMKVAQSSNLLTLSEEEAYWQLKSFPDNNVRGFVLDEKSQDDNAWYMLGSGVVTITKNLYDNLVKDHGNDAKRPLVAVLRHEGWHSSYSKIWPSDLSSSQATILNWLEDYRNHQSLGIMYPTHGRDIFMGLETIQKNRKHVEPKDTRDKVLDVLSRWMSDATENDFERRVTSLKIDDEEAQRYIDAVKPHVLNFASQGPNPFDPPANLRKSALAIESAQEIFRILNPLFKFDVEKEIEKGIPMKGLKEKIREIIDRRRKEQEKKDQGQDKAQGKESKDQGKDKGQEQGPGNASKEGPGDVPGEGAGPGDDAGAGKGSPGQGSGAGQPGQGGAGKPGQGQSDQGEHGQGQPGKGQSNQTNGNPQPGAGTGEQPTSGASSDAVDSWLESMPTRVLESILSALESGKLGKEGSGMGVLLIPEGAETMDSDTIKRVATETNTESLKDMLSNRTIESGESVRFNAPAITGRLVQSFQQKNSRVIQNFLQQLNSVRPIPDEEGNGKSFWSPIGAELDIDRYIAQQVDQLNNQSMYVKRGGTPNPQDPLRKNPNVRKAQILCNGLCHVCSNLQAARYVMAILYSVLDKAGAKVDVKAAVAQPKQIWDIKDAHKRQPPHKVVSEIYKLIQEGNVPIRPLLDDSELGPKFLRTIFIKDFCTTDHEAKEVNEFLKKTKGPHLTIAIPSGPRSSVYMDTVGQCITLQTPRDQLKPAHLFQLLSHAFQWIRDPVGFEATHDKMLVVENNPPRPIMHMEVL